MVVSRFLGNVALIVGLLVTVVGLVSEDPPGKSFFFAALLVVIGLGLRIESVLADRQS